MKSPEEMYDEGWCKDCNYCYAKCFMKGKCKGYSEEEDEDATAETNI